MGLITYVAKASFVGGHIAGQAYTLEIDVSDFRRSRSVKKKAVRSLGGAMEVLKDHSDTEWQITFEPVGGDMLARLREFLDSTEGGELFTLDIYGGSSSVTMKRTDEGYTEEPFIRRGSESTDLFQVSITAIRA